MHDQKLQIQGIKVNLKCDMCIGFIYCRSTPTNEDVEFLSNLFADCHILLGDFNLSHRIKSGTRDWGEKNRLSLRGIALHFSGETSLF